LHPEVKQLLEEWISQQPALQPTDFLFTRHGERIAGSVWIKPFGVSPKMPASPARSLLAPHLATLAINRGMSLESIANLLGHRSLSMSLVYTRITVHQDYSAVT